MVVVLSWSEAPSWVAARLAQPAVRGGSRTRWVGVDGLGGAGKSSLATAIAAADVMRGACCSGSPAAPPRVWAATSAGT